MMPELFNALEVFGAMLQLLRASAVALRPCDPIGGNT